MRPVLPAAATTVIVGGGQAAATVATELRRLGYGGRVVMVAGEPHLPYDRTALSKKFLLDTVPASKIAYRSSDSYDKLGITLFLNRRVASVDRAAKRVLLTDGVAIGYDNLVLATGSEARPLVLPGADTSAFLALRNLSDAEKLKPRLGPEARLIVLGGGFLGLEVASSAVTLGASVTVIEAQDRLLGRSASPSFSAEVARLHASKGVNLKLSEAARHFRPEGTGGVLETTEDSYPADVVLAAIGSRPSVEIAAAAGLSCQDGILTDRDCRTSDPSIYAIGDCAARYYEELGAYHRSEAVYSAIAQASRAAASIAGAPAPAERTAYFWSEQFGLRMQIAGSIAAGMEVEDLILRSRTSGFAVCRFQAGKLASVETLDDPKRFVVGRNLIGKDKDEALRSLEA